MGLELSVEIDLVSLDCVLSNCFRSFTCDVNSIFGFKLLVEKWWDEFVEKRRFLNFFLKNKYNVDKERVLNVKLIFVDFVKRFRF